MDRVTTLQCQVKLGSSRFGEDFLGFPTFCERFVLALLPFSPLAFFCAAARSKISRSSFVRRDARNQDLEGRTTEQNRKLGS